MFVLWINFVINFVFRVCRVFLSVRCSLVVTCWERADLLALLCVMFYCVFVASPCGVLDQVWCLIVSIPDFLPSFLLLFSSTCSFRLNNESEKKLMVKTHLLKRHML